MSAQHRHQEGDPPWSRTTGAKSMPCPFCGSRELLLGYGDHPDDDRRIELYCNNDHCAAREITVLARMRSAADRTRADLIALRAVDEGTERERLSGSVTPAEILDHDPGTSLLERRRRSARVTVDTVDGHVGADPADA